MRVVATNCWGFRVTRSAAGHTQKQSIREWERGRWSGNEATEVGVEVTPVASVEYLFVCRFLASVCESPNVTATEDLRGE